MQYVGKRGFLGCSIGVLGVLGMEPEEFPLWPRYRAEQGIS